MNANKKLRQGFVLLVSTLALIVGAVFTGNDAANVPMDVTVTGRNAKAGVVASLEQTESNMLDGIQVANARVEKVQTQLVTVAARSEAADVISQDDAQTVTASAVTTEPADTADPTTDSSGDAAATDTADKDTQEDKEEDKKQLSKTEKEWQNKVMADVTDSLAIRAKGSKDAKIVGKMYPTSVATVVKKGKSWTKIKSGNLTGYVKNKYLLFGQEAYDHAKKVCKKYAYVQTDGLRVRSKAKESAKVLTVADKGDKLLYNKKAKKKDGWVAVSVKAGKGYVSAEYVKVKLGTTKAVSIEEEIAAQKAKEAAAKAATVSASSASTQHAATSASTDDTTLLAAIIQCEAGSECYEGKVAVGAVVLNRVRSSSYPNSISGVVYQRGQFSPVRNGSLARVLASGNISSACRQAAADALGGADSTNGKLNFHRVNGRSGLVIGNHVFF